MMRASLVLGVLAGCAWVAAGQDCVTPGLQCRDDDTCCGGCCQSGICISTVEDCELKEDVCLDHYCPPGFECRVFRPRGCDGCASQPLCKPFLDD